MIVCKFGGSSISNSENIINVCEIIRTKSATHKITCVFSAFGNTTNIILNCAEACLKKDKIAVSEFRSFFSCYLARLSFINSASKYNILWEGEMHLIPTIHLKKETISKVIDILLSVNQEMIYAIVSMDIEEDEAFTRIMADKNNGKNRRFNKDQKFTIDDLRKFSLFQKYLIETLNNKKIHFLEYDENQEDITKFIGKF